MVLVDAGSNDIRAACRTIMPEHGGQSNAGNDAADNHRHEVLSLAHKLEGQVGAFLFGNDVLYELQQQVEHQYGIDGLHQEFPS